MARGRKKAKIYEFGEQLQLGESELSLIKISERLLDIRDQEIEDGPQKGDREIRYLVKWKGFGPQHDSSVRTISVNWTELMRLGG